MAGNPRQIKCLVTGAAGFIGSHITELCIKHGYAATAVDDLSTGNMQNLQSAMNLAGPKQLTFLKRDIRDKSFIKSLGKIDYIFHCAALASVQASIAYPVHAHEINVDGTLNILEYCLEHRAKLIFSSTSAIYDSTLPSPYTEDSNIEPLSPYALQKLQAEQYIEMFHKLYGLEYSILRYSNVFGERQSVGGAYPAVSAIFLKRKAEGLPLEITGDGKQRRDMVYVKDVAIANLMAMDWQGTFNIAQGYSYSINDIAGFIGGEKKYGEARTGEMIDNTLVINKAKQAGWKPSMDIKDWLGRINVNTV